MSSKHLRHGVGAIRSLPAVTQERNVHISSGMLRTIVTPTSISSIHLLQLPNRRPVVCSVAQLQCVRGQPLSLRQSRLPTCLFPLFLAHSLAAPFCAVFRHSCNICPYGISRALRSIINSRRRGRLLRVRTKAPLVHVRQVTCTSSKYPFRHTASICVTSHVQFAVRRSNCMHLSTASARGVAGWTKEFFNCAVQQSTTRQIDSIQFSDYDLHDARLAYISAILVRVGDSTTASLCI